MQPKTETKTQQRDTAVRLPAHLGIWLKNRHWCGQPSLLYTRMHMHRAGEDSKDRGYSAGLKDSNTAACPRGSELSAAEGGGRASDQV